MSQQSELILICTPWHALAEETAAALRDDGGSVAVLRGYQAMRMGKPMCRDIEAVRAVLAVQAPVQTTVCADEHGRTCPHFDGCPKQANRREVAAADVVVAPYDALFTGFPIKPEDIALILIDEGCWGRAVEPRAELSTANFANDLLHHDPSRGGDAFGATADLQALRKRAAAAFAGNGAGPVSRDALRAAGLRLDDVDVATGLERRRLRDPGLCPGMPPDERRIALQRAGVNARTQEYISVWRAIGRLLVAPSDLSGRLALGPADKAGGGQRILVQDVKPLHVNLRGRPILHLDATLRPELASASLPRLEVTEIDAAAPFMEVRLIAGGFGKRKLSGGGSDPGEARRRARRLAE